MYCLLLEEVDIIMLRAPVVELVKALSLSHVISSETPGLVPESSSPLSLMP